MINYLFFLLVPFIVLYVIYFIKNKTKNVHLKKSFKTLTVIGSGGHTQEMINQMKTLNFKVYTPRLYVMAETDTSSGYKIKELEEKCFASNNYDIVTIPRSRSVSQSYITSVFTTLISTLSCIPIVFKFKPDLILCNGPGTCIPICVVGFLMNKLLLCNTKIVFVESICRVKTLSLSGKILLYFADVVIVQWEYLHKKYPQTVFLGRLV